MKKNAAAGKARLLCPRLPRARHRAAALWLAWRSIKARPRAVVREGRRACCVQATAVLCASARRRAVALWLVRRSVETHAAMLLRPVSETVAWQAAPALCRGL